MCHNSLGIDGRGIFQGRNAISLLDDNKPLSGWQAQDVEIHLGIRLLPASQHISATCVTIII